MYGLCACVCDVFDLNGFLVGYAERLRSGQLPLFSRSKSSFHLILKNSYKCPSFTSKLNLSKTQ